MFCSLALVDSSFNKRVVKYLCTAMTDPVADKSGFLCMYMSSHPDTLVSYAKHYGQIREHITSAKMESIDSQVCVQSCLLSSSLTCIVFCRA